MHNLLFFLLLLILFACPESVYGGYVWKLIPSIEISEGYESSDGKIVSRSLIKPEYIEDYFTSAKPALSLFLRPSDTLYVNAEYSLNKKVYSDYTDYNMEEKVAHLFMHYAAFNYLSLGASVSHEEFQMEEFDYMDYKSTSTRPFAGIMINGLTLTLSKNILRKEYEKRLFQILDPLEENYYKDELMLSYSFSHSKLIGLGAYYGQNESNFSVYDYHYKGMFLTGRFNLYKKVKAVLFYRKELIKYDRLPEHYEVVYLFGLNPDPAQPDKNSILSKREDREDTFSLQIYSIINSWLKLSLDYAYVSNHSNYAWEEHESHIALFSIKLFQRYKK